MALGVLKDWYTKTELGSNANGLGASLIGIEDDGGYFTGTEVETALQELGAGLASENLWDRTGTVLTTHTAGDKIKLDSGASLYWDNGSGTADIQLYRSAANVLRTPDSLYVDTRINVGSAGEAYVRGIVDMHGTGFPIARYCNKINGNDSGAFTGFSGINSTNYLTKETTGVAGNGFGHGLVFGVKDSTMSGDSNFITRIYARSDDNDGTGDTGWGRLQFWVGSNGTKRS